MNHGAIPHDLVDDVRTIELMETFGGMPSQWDKEDKHEIDRLLAVSRGLNSARRKEAELNAAYAKSRAARG